MENFKNSQTEKESKEDQVFLGGERGCEEVPMEKEKQEACYGKK